MRPLTLGADIVVHSTTKYCGGHSDVVGGAVVAKDPAQVEELAWWANCLGLTGSPFDSFQTLRGLRTLADFDNYRKRAEKERAEMRRHAAAETVRDFLEVVDNLERALSAGGSAGGSADDLRTGIEMILRQVEDLLRRHGVERVAAEGEAFDPAIHEAVSRQEDPAVSEPRVVHVMQTGDEVTDIVQIASVAVMDAMGRE